MADQPNDNLPAQSPQQLPPDLARVMGSLSPEDKKILGKYIRGNRVQISRTHVLETTVHSGPLPPPEVLKAYEEIAAGFANRIITMAESQSIHRIELEKCVIPQREKLPGRGQIFAFLLGLFGISCGTYCIISGQPVAGSIIGGSTVVSLVTVFLVGRSKQEKDLSQKRP